MAPLWAIPLENWALIFIIQSGVIYVLSITSGRQAEDIAVAQGEILKQFLTQRHYSLRMVSLKRNTYQVALK